MPRDDVKLWDFWDRAFELPWRSVLGPVRCCAAMALSIDTSLSKNYTMLFSWVAEPTRELSYWALDDEIASMRAHTGAAAVATQSGLRCLQLYVSKSDGGGAIYNIPLQKAVAHVTYTGALDEETVDAILCDARAKDASDDPQVRDVVRGRYKRRLLTGLYF